MGLAVKSLGQKAAAELVAQCCSREVELGLFVRLVSPESVAASAIALHSLHIVPQGDRGVVQLAMAMLIPEHTAAIEVSISTAAAISRKSSSTSNISPESLG